MKTNSSFYLYQVLYAVAASSLGRSQQGCVTLRVLRIHQRKSVRSTHCQNRRLYHSSVAATGGGVYVLVGLLEDPIQGMPVSASSALQERVIRSVIDPCMYECKNK